MSRRDSRRNERSSYRRRSRRRRDSSSDRSGGRSERNALEQGEVRLSGSKNAPSDDKFGSKNPMTKKPYKVVLRLDDEFVEKLIGSDPSRASQLSEASMVKEFHFSKSRSKETKDYQTISIFDEDESRKWPVVDRVLDKYYEHLKAVTPLQPNEATELRSFEYMLIIPDGRISLPWSAVSDFRPCLALDRQERKTDPGNHERNLHEDCCQQVS